MVRARELRRLYVADAAAGRRPLAAASGLVRAGAALYVVADDEHELAAFALEGEADGTLARFDPAQLPAEPRERKRAKADVEALALLPARPGQPAGALLALGSGSRPQRMRGFVWRLDARGRLHGEALPVDLRPLYEELARAIPDLNVEGAAVAGGRLLLLQRGNGRGGVDAVVALELERALAELERGLLSGEAIVELRRHDLGETAGVRLSFSDAAPLPDGRVVFCAVAEAGEDTYRDGACVGAAVGVLGAGGDVLVQHALEPLAKIEGVEARARGGAIDLLLVADGDDPRVPAPLLAARIDGA